MENEVKDKKAKKVEEAKAEPSLEIQLLQEKLKNLEAKVTKPKTSEEEFQERVAKYEASKSAREALKADIEARRMKMWAENPKAKRHEIELLEAWDRRAEELKHINPGHSESLRNTARAKRREIDRDQSR